VTVHTYGSLERDRQRTGEMASTRARVPITACLTYLPLVLIDGRFSDDIFSDAVYAIVASTIWPIASL